MKKVIAVAVLICALLSGCGGKYSSQVEIATDALANEWGALCEEYETLWGEDIENKIKVTNTKVWIIRNTKVDEFQKIDYIVEFEIEIDIGYEGYNNVAVYNDGRAAVLGASPFDLYAERTGSRDFSDFVDGEVDLKKKYNKTINLE